MSYNVILEAKDTDRRLLYSASDRGFAELYRHAYLDAIAACTPGFKRHSNCFIHDGAGTVVYKCVIQELEGDPDTVKGLDCGCVMTSKGISIFCEEAKRLGKAYMESAGLESEESAFKVYMTHYGEHWNREKELPNVIREI